MAIKSPLIFKKGWSKGLDGFNMNPFAGTCPHNV